MRIALDAMGGDFGPAPNVAGAVLALCTSPDLTVVLVGDRAQIDPLLAQASNFPADRLEVFHASQAVGMHEKPVDALRKKPDSSIARCWQLMRDKAVDGLISAGNTGAIVAAGLRLRLFLKCVHRPGIATVMPTAKGHCVLLDVGANVFPKPRHLLDYAVMGAVFAEHMLGCKNPTIGLMNVGEEEGKGHDLVRETYDLFRASPINNRFVGNVEGRDIHRGAADVIVTDGFTGNVVLKLSEGVFEFVMSLVNQDVVGALSAEKDKGRAAVKGLLDRFHHSTFGGAPLLGIDGVCIIGHGSSTDKAIANALGVAAQNVRVRLNDRIVEALEALPAEAEE